VGDGIGSRNGSKKTGHIHRPSRGEERREENQMDGTAETVIAPVIDIEMKQPRRCCTGPPRFLHKIEVPIHKRS